MVAGLPLQQGNIMWGILLYATAAVALVHGGELRKCCNLLEKLSENFECVPHDRGNISVVDNELLRWIPGSEIDADNNTLQDVLRNTTIVFGKLPACGQKHMDILEGSGSDHYRIFIDQAGNFRLNVSKISSVLDGEDTNLWDRPSLAPTDFCLDLIDMDETLLWVAAVCPCGALPCVRKCCPEGQSFDVAAYECAQLEGRSQDMYGYWSPKLQDPVPKSHFYRLTSALPDCPGKAFMDVTNGSDNKHFVVLKDGSLKVSSHEPPVPSGLYCGDYTTDGGSSEVIFACWTGSEYGDLENMLYGIGLVLSAAVLLVTVLIQWMSNATSTLHGRLGFTHNCGIFMGFLMLSAIQLGPNRPLFGVCMGLAFIIQFSFLAAFFWLNVMCIDISWAFSGIRPPQGSVTERDHKKFLYYSIYAWGSPTVITIVTAIMEFDESIPNTFVKPNFGVAACWFEEKIAAFAYFYGPMAVLLVANFALFIYTTIKIIKVQRDTRILRNGESGRHDGSSNFKKDKKRLILYAKLFCLMGLTWVTEIISWLHGSAQYYWYITDAINLLRAVFIFIIFCCKRKVFRLLKQRLFPSLASKNNASQSNGTRKSSSSTQQSSLQSMQMAQINGNSKGNSTNTGNP